MDRFEQLLQDAYDELPDWVERELDNVQIVAADEPPPDNPGLMGLYEGVPRPQRVFGYTGAMPDCITLFRSTIEAQAGEDDERLRALVARTLHHEIAHHLGIDDDRLREIGAH